MRIKLLRNIAILFCLSCAITVQGQDIHFSQFYASPLNLNPALTGFSEGSYRIAGIYRNQWRSFTTPFVTYSTSYDMRILQDRIKEDLLGVGGAFYNDRSGDGDLGILSFMLSSSYHKKLSKYSRQYLGLGVQVGAVQKSVNYAQLTFPSQFTGDDFDINQPNNENFESDNIMYFDMQLGMMWYGSFSKKLDAFNGVSLFHLTKPTESFLGRDVKLESRYVVHGGLKIKTSEKIYLTPNYIFMYQNKAQELNVGTAVEYHIPGSGDPTIVSLGGWVRWDDAAIASASIEYRRIRLGVSYDFNVSQLNEATHARGGFELSLIYIGKLIQDEMGPILVPCPRL